MERFDLLVLGGGTAGCVLAGRLSEDSSRRVCLVEAGPDYGAYTDGRWPEDMLDARQLAFSHSWDAEPEDDRSQLRARILGGCSAHNACVLLEGAPSDYDWGPGWSYRELEPYLRRAEGELLRHTFALDELSPWHRLFAEAGGADAILHPLNAVGTVRWNAAFAYVDPARARENLTILGDTLVDCVLLDGRRVVGASTSRGELRAGVVVVAAGAYGSPAILLRSGIDDLPVGEGLLDHVGVGFAYEPTEAMRAQMAEFEASQPLWMGQVTVRAHSSLCPDDVCDLFFFPATDPGGAISAAVFAMKPVSRGRVSLRSRDPEAPLAIQHGFLRDERDARVLADGVELVRAFVGGEAFAPWVAREERPGADVRADVYVRAAKRGFFHPTGTCAIGSVVDERCRVIGYEGLAVADAAVMPEIPRANTNLTVAAIAERVAEWL
ncbi:MAG TPA: GMC oxidoreductase [Gaiellaceae bacterium]